MGRGGDGGAGSGERVTDWGRGLGRFLGVAEASPGKGRRYGGGRAGPWSVGGVAWAGTEKTEAGPKVGVGRAGPWRERGGALAGRFPGLGEDGEGGEGRGKVRGGNLPWAGTGH